MNSVKNLYSVLFLSFSLSLVSCDNSLHLNKSTQIEGINMNNENSIHLNEDQIRLFNIIDYFTTNYSYSTIQISDYFDTNFTVTQDEFNSLTKLTPTSQSSNVKSIEFGDDAESAGWLSLELENPVHFNTDEFIQLMKTNNYEYYGLIDLHNLIQGCFKVEEYDGKLIKTWVSFKSEYNSTEVTGLSFTRYLEQ